jgi:hypothetical protein
MAQLITRVRLLIADPSGSSSQFQDQDIQDTLDESVDFLRYESLLIAPTIMNAASTGNQASTIFINYFSRYQWWEQDVVLQGYANGQAWVVIAPVQSDYINGHFWFETPSLEFTAPTVPGQLPPIFATGKVYDPHSAAADLLEFWAATLAAAYDVTVDGQTMRRSQLMQAKLTLAAQYRRKAKPRIAKMERSDVMPQIDSMKMRLLDNSDSVKGA